MLNSGDLPHTIVSADGRFSRKNAAETGNDAATVEKRCPKCQITKPLAEYHTRIRNGKRVTQPYCHPCHIAYHKGWRGTPEGQAKFSKSENASKRRYPERKRARDLLSQAVKRGKVKPLPCCIGGDCAGGVEAHHHDYSKPLDVQWVCRKHHRILDRMRTGMI